MSFLAEIASEAIGQYGSSLNELTVVFPNRRSGHFFRKQLSGMIDRPQWAPRVLSIVDFIRSLSALQPAEQLDLVMRLYRIMSGLRNIGESLDRFWYWGETLLRDFEEIDKFMIPPGDIFRNLAEIKRLEESLDYLTEEQKALISGFWKSFEGRISSQQQHFAAVWDLLLPAYGKFTDELLASGLAYDGLLYRTVAGEIGESLVYDRYHHVYFAGFNALSTSEERIITWFVQSGRARVFWEADDYYLKDEKQEAGHFLRDLKRRNRVLAATFRESYGSLAGHLAGKRIEVTPAPLRVGQAQVLARLLEQTRQFHPGAFEKARSAVVLPDEKLLFPVLNAMPSGVEAMNITMGYPLSSTLAFSWVSVLIDLQLHPANRPGLYYHRPVLAVLGHPYLRAENDDVLREFRTGIIRQNRIYIPEKELTAADPRLATIFRRAERPADLIGYLKEQLSDAAGHLDDPLEQEFLYHLYLLLNQLIQYAGGVLHNCDGKAFLRLFRQMLLQYKLPFEGEPLEGLQVMGLLETRNLDFDHVFILATNEGVFPATGQQASYLPPGIRRAFGLPTAQQRDALHAYVFYNMVRQAEHLHIIYNEADDQGMPGEVSRFVRQLEAETAADIVYRNPSFEIRIPPPRHIRIEKDQTVMSRLYRFDSQNGQASRKLTPSAINRYLDCTLRFYYQDILGLSEEEEVQEEVDALLLGNIFHRVMEMAYRPALNAGGLLTADTIRNIGDKIDGIIDEAYAHYFGQGSGFALTGLQAVSRVVVRKMALRVLEIDLREAPIVLEGLEDGSCTAYLDIAVNSRKLKVGLKGIIDRIDRVGDKIRILDYKTGKDERKFKSLASLFDRDDPKRNKAAMQALYYGLLFIRTNPEIEGRLETGLFNLRNLFDADFSYLFESEELGVVSDFRVMHTEFAEHLGNLVVEIFDSSMPFAQTDDLKKCRLCSFAGLCRRD